MQKQKIMSEIGDFILKYDRQIPRYTSYPTAPHFSSSVNHETYKNWLEKIANGTKLSLYFHIPFCDQLCWYCGCFTTITKRYEPIANYLQILLQEMRLVGSLLKEKNLEVAHIHFGGGSPTILLPQDFSKLMHEIRKNFSVKKDAEIAIEIDPRNIDQEKIKTYFEEGVNRASIGVQDFNLEVQKAINREQSFDVVNQCVKLLRQNHIENINLDLIYGLPKQNVEMIDKNIDRALSLEPSRIALFAYAHVQWKKKQMRLIDENDLPKNNQRILMYDLALKKLQLAGYFAIGLDHFAKKNDTMFASFCDKKLKRNFQGYSSDCGDALIGFGASSISFLESGYAQNTTDFEQYKKQILGNNFATIKGVEMSAENKIRKKIIDEIMCYLEVDLEKICQEFGLEPQRFSAEIASLQNLQNDGLITINNQNIAINPSAPQISRVVCSAFDEYFVESQKMYSKAV